MRALLMKKVAPASYDTDAQDYFTRVEAHGVTITTAQKGYFNTLFVDLKSNSLYTIPYDMYFFGWANAAANAEPLKGVAPDITWSGTVTHGATGVVGDGSTGYGDLGYAANTMTLNNSHVAVYSRTNSNTTAADIGARGAVTTQRFELYARIGGNFRVDMNSNTAGSGSVVFAQASSAGLSIGTRISSTDLRLIRNGSQVGTTSTTTNNGTFAAQNIYILATNTNGTAGSFSAREYIMASLGTGFTTTEAATYSTIWNTLMTSLSLNTY